MTLCSLQPSAFNVGEVLSAFFGLSVGFQVEPAAASHPICREPSVNLLRPQPASLTVRRLMSGLTRLRDTSNRCSQK